MPDLEDREGEVRQTSFDVLFTTHFTQTALHKAALRGHLSIIEYLLPQRADVHASDVDGWTALHNACSKVRPRPILHSSFFMVNTNRAIST